MPEQVGSRFSTIRSLAAAPKTDISSLPLELHAEILEALGHWTHFLVASQVCRAWRDLLGRYRDRSGYYQKVTGPAVVSVLRQFGEPIPKSPTSDFIHTRHSLLQECTIAYRHCPVTGKRQMKINPSKNNGFYDPEALCYFVDGNGRPKFYNFGYFSMLGSPVATDTREAANQPKLTVQFQKMCGRTTWPLVDPKGAFIPLGRLLEMVFERYKQCYDFKCHDCATKFTSERIRDTSGSIDAAYESLTRGLEWDVDYGDWQVSGLEELGKQCNEFGVIIQEVEKKRSGGVITLRVCPAERW